MSRPRPRRSVRRHPAPVHPSGHARPTPDAVGCVEPMEPRQYLAAAPFLPPDLYETGHALTSVVADYFFDSGAIDLAVSGPEGVSVLAGQGDGTFADPVKLSSRGGALASEDFDGDFIPDLVATDPATGSVRVWLSHGDGTFSAPIVSPAGPAPAAVASGYFDDDDNVDLAVAGGGGLMLLRGRGDGTFDKPIKLAGLADGPFQAVTAGDFDGDGLTDIAAAGGGRVLVLRQNDQGTFDAPATYAAGSPAATASSGPVGLLAADLNNDGADDLVVTAPDAGAVDVLLSRSDADTGEPDGTFAPAVRVSAGASPRAIDYGYFDGDDNPDLFIANGGGGFTVLPGDGNGVFSAPQHFAANGPSAALVAEDLNDDGETDVALAGDNGAAVLLRSAPDVGVTLDGTPAPGTPATIGKDLTLVATVTNNGGGDAGGVTLTESLPDGVTLVSAKSSRGTVDASAAGSVVARLGDLADGDSATVTLVVRPTKYGPLSMTATVASDSLDPDPFDDSDSYTTRVIGTTGAEVEITQDGQGNSGVGIPIDPIPVGVPVAGTGTGTGTGTTPGGTVIGLPPIPGGPGGGSGGLSTIAFLGEDFAYTLTVTNYGPDAAKGLVVTDTLPAGLPFVSADAGAAAIDTSTPGVVRIDLGDLAAGASAEVTITVNAAKAGTFTNAAKVAAADPTADPYLDDNASTLDTQVFDQPPPVFTPTPTPTPVPVDGGTGATGGTGGIGSGARLSIADARLQEGNSGTKDLAFTVTRLGPRTGTATVHFATANGSAKAGSDYLARSGTLTFRPGVSTLRVKVPVKGDTTSEADERFSVQLTAATGASISRGKATGTILNDDAESPTPKPPKTGPKPAPIRINFAPAGAAAVAGYKADTGLAFGNRGGGLQYGWNADNKASARDRNVLKDQRYDTFNLLRNAAGPTRWEIALPNGKYKVHLVAGDAARAAGVFRVNAEGSPLLAGTPTSGHHFVEATKTVTVRDGRLTLTSGRGAINNKLAFVEILPA